MRIRGDVSSQFLTGVLQALPLLHREVRRRRRRRAHLDALRRHHARSDAALRRDGGAGSRARWHAALPRARRRALREPGALPRRGRRVVGVVFPGGGCARRRAGARRRRRARQRAGRRRVCRRARRDGRADRPRRRLDRGARRQRACGHRPRLQTHPRRRDDGGGGGAVRRGPTTLRNIGSWRVKETDRIDAMARELSQAGRHGRRGAGLAARVPAAGASPGDDRHLRRPSHGDVLLAGDAGRGGGAHQRSGLRAQDVSRLLRRIREAGAAGSARVRA